MGGQDVHSYGRMIFNERLITSLTQLQPPNNDSGDGRIECRVSSVGAKFSYSGCTISTDTIVEIFIWSNFKVDLMLIRDIISTIL